MSIGAGEIKVELIEETSKTSKVGKIQLPTHLLLTSEAFTSMETDCRAAGKNETGGLLVGCRVRFEQTLTLAVLYVSGPGESAVHAPEHFAPDINFLQSELDRVSQTLAEQDLKVGFLGIWHRHPAQYPKPSSGDIAQAEDILKDADYGLIYPELLIPIALFQEDQLTFKPYYVADWQPEPYLLELLILDKQDLVELLLENTAKAEK